ncbi:MAG: MBL fold metallo-hydrolase [Peptococcaceae bacterium]|nr:MBL fold metallo-hydrolase [Peptococcaceae bacterium]
MVQEILPGIYKIEVILPRSPLGATNSYLIKGRERNLLIDTGWNREESRKALFDGLAALDVVFEKTDILLTHLHADHSGLAGEVATEKSKVYCGRIDSEIVNAMAGATNYWKEIGAVFGMHGFPAKDLHTAMHNHPGRRFSARKEQTFTILGGEDVVEVGDYRFTCIETPGHTPGHICLYEPDNKVLISGDHILDDITPNITFEKNIENPLGHYLQSLDKINRLEIELVLTGHQSLIHDISKRIGELKEHHHARLEEVLVILGNGRMNAYNVAAKMTWDIIPSSWDLFPLAQKMFAVGEAATHLEYLQYSGVVKRIEIDGQIYFEIN